MTFPLIHRIHATLAFALLLVGTASVPAVAGDGERIIAIVAQKQVQQGTKHLLTFLSRAERAAIKANPSGGSRFTGTAVHRATAKALRQMYGSRFGYSATHSFDFIDYLCKIAR